jgi:hypothetical protein
MALPGNFAFRSIGVMENWSIGKQKAAPARLFKNQVCLMPQSMIRYFFHNSITPVLQYSIIY